MRISDWSSDVCSSDLRAGWRARIAISPRVHSDCHPGQASAGSASRDPWLGQAPGGSIGPGSRSRDARLSGVTVRGRAIAVRSEEHTSELQSLMRISYAVFCLKKKKKIQTNSNNTI